jgi:cytochrome c peroxidase
MSVLKTTSGLFLLATCVTLASAAAPFAPAIATEQALAQKALGERIFKDASLSADGTVSCASCHQPDRAFSDSRRVAVGIRQQSGTRNTPSLATIGRSPSPTYFWDGRRSSLETVVLDPFINPVEMGLPDHESLLLRIQRNPSYQAQFGAAFPGRGINVNVREIALVLSAYIRSIDVGDSAFDRYASGKDKNALSAQAQRGFALFKGKARCAECHLTTGSPASLTDHGFHRTGIGMSSVESELPRLTTDVINRSLGDAALGNRIATHEEEAQLGRFNVTHNVEDIGLFRTPSLRGVSKTSPYMHDGSIETLPKALEMEIYYRGLTSGHPLGLTAEEKGDLLEFLKQL